MPRYIFRTLLGALALLSLPAVASADHWDNRGWGDHGGHHHHHHRHHYPQYGYVATGPVYYNGYYYQQPMPQPVYFAPEPVYYSPAPILSVNIPLGR